MPDSLFAVEFYYGVVHCKGHFKILDWIIANDGRFHHGLLPFDSLRLSCRNQKLRKMVQSEGNEIILTFPKFVDGIAVH